MRIREGLLICRPVPIPSILRPDSQGGVAISMADRRESGYKQQAKVILKDPFVSNVSKLVPLLVDHKEPPMRGH